MTFSIKKFITVTIGLVIGVLTPCMSFRCPYVIHRCEILSEKTNGGCEYGLAFIEIENLSEQTITAVEMVFCVTDENEDNPFLGSNSVQSYSKVHIETGNSSAICISLDDYMQGDMDDKLFIRDFYLRRIWFEDGGSWKDLSGRYSTEDEY